jgi:hypothetical protein
MNTVNHTDRDHAEFSPSALKYLHTCSGFHGKEGSSDAADMGTRIHEALEVRDPSTLQSEEEVNIYDQLVVDEKEVFDSVFGDMLDNVEIIREKRLHLELDALSPTFGTCDIVAISSLGVALVADYKTGISIIDPPRANWQAMAYTLGVFQTYPAVDVIHFAFLVPRNGGVITGTFYRTEIDDLRSRISSVVRSAELTRPKWASGTMEIDDLGPSSNCRFCRHEDHCPALGAVALEVVSRIKPEMLPDGPINASDVEDVETLEKLFIVARIVETWAAAIKYKANQLAQTGVEFENFKLKSMGALKKTNDKNQLAAIATEHGLSLPEIIDASDLSLAQLSKAIYDKAPKGKKSFVVDAFEKEALSQNVVSVGAVRYTLSSR